MILEKTQLPMFSPLLFDERVLLQKKDTKSRTPSLLLKPKFKFLDVAGETIVDIYILETLMNHVRRHFQEYDLVLLEFDILSPKVDSAGQAVATALKIWLSLTPPIVPSTLLVEVKPVVRIAANIMETVLSPQYTE
jgi:hypothetical protein